MEVIKNKGIPKIQRECWCCGSTLEFTRDDVEAVEYQDMDGVVSYDKFVICAVCGSRIRISRQDEIKLAYEVRLREKHIKNC